MKYLLGVGALLLLVCLSGCIPLAALWMENNSRKRADVIRFCRAKCSAEYSQKGKIDWCAEKCFKEKF